MRRGHTCGGWAAESEPVNHPLSKLKNLVWFGLKITLFCPLPLASTQPLLMCVADAIFQRLSPQKITDMKPQR